MLNRCLHIQEENRHTTVAITLKVVGPEVPVTTPFSLNGETNIGLSSSKVRSSCRASWTGVGEENST